MAATRTKEPVCLVFTPFGTKSCPRTGRTVDFDSIYLTAIQSAVEAEGGVCVRALKAIMGESWFASKHLISRLIYSELVIADITMADPNILYQIGIRQTLRSRATILVSTAEATAFDFDFVPFFSYAIYELDNTGSLTAASAVKFANALRIRIREAFDPRGPIDSPIFRAFDDFPGVDLAKMEKPAELFLSYARADAVKVEEIYEKLHAKGDEPWMDTRNIHAGEQWQKSVDRAIKNSDFFLSFLSENSVDKRGVLHKEVRQALGRWQEMLDEDIYLIPARLEPCEIPEELANFQALDVFAADWWDRLVQAISIGMEKRTQRK